jgi:5-methyltetrahydrofolate--homocysteine methyltransferase
VSQADYNLTELVYELNVAGARLARELCDEFTAANPAKPRFVAGVLGPTSRTASISPDVNDPGYRNVTFDELVANYVEAITGLVEGGADILLVETVFDTLNAKAALFAIETFFDRRPPLAGDDLGHHHRRFRPHAVRADCRGLLEFAEPHQAAVLRPQLRARRQGIAPVRRGAVARLRLLRLGPPERRPAQRLRRLRRDAEMLADEIESWARTGIVNIVGGCCGTSPEHIAAIARGLLRSTREKCRKSRRSCACPASNRSTSARIRCTSTSANAPTSPAPRPLPA